MGLTGTGPRVVKAKPDAETAPPSPPCRCAPLYLATHLASVLVTHLRLPCGRRCRRVAPKPQCLSGSIAGRIYMPIFLVVIFALIWCIRLWVVHKCSLRLSKREFRRYGLLSFLLTRARMMQFRRMPVATS